MLDGALRCSLYDGFLKAFIPFSMTYPLLQRAHSIHTFFLPYSLRSIHTPCHARVYALRFCYFLLAIACRCFGSVWVCVRNKHYLCISCFLCAISANLFFFASISRKQLNNAPSFRCSLSLSRSSSRFLIDTVHISSLPFVTSDINA